MYVRPVREEEAEEKRLRVAEETEVSETNEDKIKAPRLESETKRRADAWDTVRYTLATTSMLSVLAAS